VFAALGSLGLAAAGVLPGCGDTEAEAEPSVAPSAASTDGAARDPRDPSSSDAGTGPTSGPSSGGAGGLSCASRGNLPAGRSYCVQAFGGAELKLAEPADVASGEPLRLALYLHGDGAGAHRSDSAMKSLLAWADAHHALIGSVLSPNRCAWWQVPTQTDCSEQAAAVPDTTGKNADALRAVIDAIRAAYDVTDGPTFYYGSSGGSIFLSRSFLRRFGDRYPGVFALNCGGAKNDLPFDWNAASATTRGGTRLSFTYGDQDYLQPEIEEAVGHYRGVGFAIDTKVIPGAAHCAFDGHGRAAEVWSAFLGE